MKFTTSLAHEKNQQIYRVQQDIKNLLQHQILNEFSEIKQNIEELLLKVNDIKFKNTNPTILEGNLASADEILTMIKESSGYTKWTFSDTENLDSEQIEDIKDSYNVDFDTKEIQRHIFYRSTNDRNALSTIMVTVLPGLFQVDLHTNRVGYCLQGLIDKKQFEEGIARESDN